MVSRRGSERGRLRRPPNRLGIELLCGALAMTLTLQGCWMVALQLAPYAIQAVETVGYGVLRMAAQATMSSSGSDRGKTPDSKEQIHQACASLEMEAPLIIEFHTDASGTAIRYRELTLKGELGSPQWRAVPDQEADAQGWRPASHFAQMEFNPSINSWLKPGTSSYIAYVPEVTDDLEDREEYSDLVTDFGPRFGTFHWQGNVYDYGVLPKLPCFPPPPD
jgi:hypothetical protein